MFACVNEARTKLVLLILVLVAATSVVVYIWMPGHLVAQDEPQQFVHCFSVVQHEDGSVGYLGHPPMDKELQPDPGDKLVETRCLQTWAEVASFISGGAIKLPADATQKDYELATEEWAR